MTLTLTFSNIKSIKIKSFSEITKSERSEGRLQAGAIVRMFQPGMKLDVFIVENMPELQCVDSISFNEDDIREGSRRVFTTISKNAWAQWKLPVKTDFFKGIQDGDTIVMILHDSALQYV
jgi:hypothetical protein